MRALRVKSVWKLFFCCFRKGRITERQWWREKFTLGDVENQTFNELIFEFLIYLFSTVGCIQWPRYKLLANDRTKDSLIKYYRKIKQNKAGRNLGRHVNSSQRRIISLMLILCSSRILFQNQPKSRYKLRFNFKCNNLISFSVSGVSSRGTISERSHQPYNIF